LVLVRARPLNARSFFSKIAEELIAAQASYFKQSRWISRSTSIVAIQHSIRVTIVQSKTVSAKSFKRADHRTVLLFSAEPSNIFGWRSLSSSV
jgi:hypothetical protein